MKRTRAAFLAAIMLLCLLPSAGLLALGPGEARANELPPQAPELLDGGGLNAGFLADAADYADEGFRFRQELITLWAGFEALFGQSAEDGVILGSEGWLYYAEDYGDYVGTGLMSEREVFAAARNLVLMAEYVEGLGADFVFTIAPNKSTLYPEHMPGWARTGAPSNAVRLAAELEAQGVAYTDLFALFEGEAEPLYFRHDSHWTSRGAAAAADAINAALGVESAYAEGYEYVTQAHSGDLYEMLYPAGRDGETDDAPVLSFSQTEGARPDSITIETEGEGEGRLLMFRDSFGELLYPFMAGSWGAARFSRQAAYDLRAAEELGCTAVAIELVERNLPWLIEQPAVFPAPEREMPGGEAAPGEAEAEIEPGEGVHRVSGVISGGIDARSPVYIVHGGVCREALISGEGFTALLPGEGGGEYGLLWYFDGVLTRADLYL